MNHLGGHCDVTHVDEGALLWLRDNGHKTFLDVGCSVGGQVGKALELGFDAYGFDGDYSLTVNPAMTNLDRILFGDITKCCPQFPVKFDAIWCVEVAEHIEAAFASNLLGMLAKNLKDDGTLVFTANSGPGFHHVHIQTMPWWIETLESFGLIYSLECTEKLREKSTMIREFIKNTGIICHKKDIA